MQRVRLTGGTTREVAERAADILRAGGVVLYPTDTLYGLGADALSDEAVARVAAIKGRGEGKPIHAIVADLKMAEAYAQLDQLARLLIERLPKGKVSVIARKRASIDSGIARELATIGFRIPDNDLCSALIGAFGGPITATSANRSDEAPMRDVDGILAQLGERAQDIDLVIDADELPPSLPSTVVDVCGKEPIILREGAVPAADVWEAVRSEY